MQSILPSTTSMKTFTIVLPVVTVSTVLAVFVLTGAIQDIQRAISSNIPSAGQKLRELMSEHPRKRWGKEQLRDSRAPGEQHSFWTYVAFCLEFCFISIPVHEVKEAIDLYGLRKQHPAPGNRFPSSESQKYLRSNTTLTFEQRLDTRDTSAKSRARQVRERQEAERKRARKGFIIGAVRQVPAALFIAVRIVLLCLWVPLLLLEYVALLIICPLTGNTTVPMQLDTQLRIGKSEQLKRFFSTPLLFLGFDVSRSNIEHEHRSPLPPPGLFDHPLEPFPSSHYYSDSGVSGNRPLGSEREPHMRGAQRLRHAIVQPNFQAAYQQQYLSNPVPAAIPTQPSTQLRPHGYPDIEGGIPRRAGGIWAELN
jgi:hypothetical protein